MLFSNNIKAQNKDEKILKKVSTYFDQLKKEGIQACINNESDLFDVAKQRKDKEMYKDLMIVCNKQASHYGLYEMDTKNLLATLYKSEDSDFIIVNMINPHNDNTVVSESTLTFSRNKNEKETHVINNHYKYNEEDERELLKDSSISDFNVEEKMKLIEDYLYYKKENSISEVSRGQPYREYYIVARINGKYLIKSLCDYNLKD